MQGAIKARHEGNRRAAEQDDGHAGAMHIDGDGHADDQHQQEQEQEGVDEEAHYVEEEEEEHSEEEEEEEEEEALSSESSSADDGADSFASPRAALRMSVRCGPLSSSSS